MKVSDKGLVALVGHEGIVPAPYYDVRGILTYGIGHTKSAGAPDPASLPKGMPADLDAAATRVIEVFKKDLAKFEDRVNDAVKVPISQSEFDALVSFDFNTGGIYVAELTKLLNQGRRREAGAAFMGWKKPLSIIPRREDEQALFLYGRYPNKTVVMWKVNGEGKVIWTPARTYTSGELLALLKVKENNVPITTPSNVTSKPVGSTPTSFWETIGRWWKR